MKSANKTKTLALALFLFGMLALTPASTTYGEAQISTDQEDYAPWEIVTITGAGFEPSTEDMPIEVSVTITWPDGYVDGPYSGTTDEWGGFTFIYGKDKFEGTYTVVVEDSTGITATTTFTDAAPKFAFTTVGSLSQTVLPGETTSPVTVNITISDGGELTYPVTTSGWNLGTVPSGLTLNVSPTGPYSWSSSSTEIAVAVSLTASTSISSGSYTFPLHLVNGSDSATKPKNVPGSPGPSFTITVPEQEDDTTPPVVTITAPADGGCYRTATLPPLAYTVTDNLDPNPTVVVNDWSTAEGTHTVIVIATDAAGNVGSDSVTYSIDNTPATVAIEIPYYINIANEAAVPVTISSNEDGEYSYKISDGVNFVTGSGAITAGVAVNLTLDLSDLDDGDITADASVVDAVGNIGYAPQETAFKDTVAPATDSVLDGELGDNAWYTSDVEVTLTAEDPSPSSGIAAIYYAVDDPDPLNFQVYSASFTISTDGIHTVYYYAVDNAGNEEDVQTKEIKIDKTRPVVTVTLPDTGLGLGVYLLNEVVSATWSAEDPIPGSGLATDPSGTVPVDTTSVGTKTLTIPAGTAKDAAGNSSVAATATYYVRYDFGGFLPPVSLDGRSLFKLGSTIPVKFQLFDAAGNPVSTAVATIKVAKISDGVAGSEVEGVSTSAATTGNLFRYDLIGQLYIFNLATKPLTAPADGTWRITVYLNDGTSQFIDIGIKK